MSSVKIANKQDQFKQKQSFKREKEHVQSFILSLFKISHNRKISSIFAMSVIEVGVHCEV